MQCVWLTFGAPTHKEEGFTWVQLALSIVLRKIQLQGGLDPPNTLAEANQSFFVLSAHTLDRDLITILQERPHISPTQSDGSLTVFALLQEATVLRWRGTTDCA
jgi:hypothetical protein